MISIKLSHFAVFDKEQKKRLDWSGIINFLKAKEYADIKTMSTEEILFSLEGFDYLNPDGLLWLLLIGEELKRKGHFLLMRFPRNPYQLRYIKALNFHEVALKNFSIVNIFELDEIESLKIPKATRFFNIDLRLLPILLSTLRIIFTSASDEFFKMLGQRSRDEIVFEYAPLFLSTIEEITKNIVQHSGEKENLGCGYFVMNPYRKEWIRLCIGDAGCGFYSDLTSKELKPQNDFEAIKMALLYRYYLHGEGLFRVVQFINKLGGIIRISSGKGEAFLNLQKPPFEGDEATKNFIEQNLKKIRRDFSFPGVQFLIDIKREETP